MKIGFTGWRGMVGSVLMQRMREEKDFKPQNDYVFFSTSSAGKQGPFEAHGHLLEDAFSVESLKKCDIIVACQGGKWTSQMYPQLMLAGWKGIWLDTSSTLRMEKGSIMVLDPINQEMIIEGLGKGVKTFVGANCVISLMLMALHGLFRANLIDWVNSSTYQAASGAGAAHMQELMEQMKFISKVLYPATNAIELDRKVLQRLHNPEFPSENFKVPLACSLIPWIDRAVEDGQTREEWKGNAEANNILPWGKRVIIDGICVRVGSMRCHSQALLIKLREFVPLKEIEEILAHSNQWVKIVPNKEEATINQLTPAAISGTLTIAVGRLHRAKFGPEYIQAFIVGDQLLWGAAEPIRRALNIILQNI